MVIANPIYDVVFKRLMENEKVAKFFIGTLLGENVDLIEVKPQEYTYDGEIDMNDPSARKALEERVLKRISIRVYRLDFVATIKTNTGEYKKILVEIQKANDPIDLMRFRNYLAEQYKKEDKINNRKVILPITTIYILGFKLPEIETACIKVERNYKDLINEKIIDKKSDFVEKLTHDSFIVQVGRITNRYQTKLDKLLSVFEQTNFIGDSTITKRYNHETDVEELGLITNILHHTGTDPEERKRIEDEQEALRTIAALFGEKENEYLEALEEKEKALVENKKALIEKDVALEKMKQEMEELKRKLAEK